MKFDKIPNPVNTNKPHPWQSEQFYAERIKATETLISEIQQRTNDYVGLGEIDEKIVKKINEIIIPKMRENSTQKWQNRFKDVLRELAEEIEGGYTKNYKGDDWIHNELGSFEGWTYMDVSCLYDILYNETLMTNSGEDDEIDFEN